jgi:hypothetical protein
MTLSDVLTQMKLEPSSGTSAGPCCAAGRCIPKRHCTARASDPRTSLRTIQVPRHVWRRPRGEGPRMPSYPGLRFGIRSWRRRRESWAR